MKFGPLKVDQVDGAILAHTVVLPDGRLTKGQVLVAEHIERLKTHGIDRVIVAKLEEGDIEENEAALRVAQALQSQHVVCSEPFTGRANLYSTDNGVFYASQDGVDNINRITPAITLATLANGEFVEKGRMVATVKIIPFATEIRAINEAEKISFRTGILTVRPALPMTVGLVSTLLPSVKTATLDKTRRVLEQRLAVSDSRLIQELRVSHAAESVAGALKQLHGQCDLMVIFGASAIADSADVIPRGVELAGGTVTSFGMPVDPGNLLMTGLLDGKPVIGAPGCARSPALNGFDLVLHRMLAGLCVDEEYITGLGVGGLLKEITSRPQLREVP